MNDKLLNTPIAEIPEYYERAKKAYLFWKNLHIHERMAYLRNLRHYMVDQLEELVEVIAKDTGKVPVEALTADILTTLDAIQYIEKHGPRVLGKRRMKTPLLLFGKKSYVEYKPRGVVLVISPWNFPLQLAMVPVISALISGNAVILKPSEVTPMVGRLIEDLFQKAGFPQDVVQVAHGGKEAGSAFVQGEPDYIFFTGSVRTGKMIQEEAAKKLIPTTLELGGKDPMIVFADANLKRAVHGAIWGAFTNAGQVCMSVERVYVERKIYDPFIKKLVEEVNQLKLGSGMNDDIGMITYPGQVSIIREHIEDALSKGAKLLTGTSPEHWILDKELFIPPMVLVDVGQDMKIMQEETFGPVLPVIPFDSEDEAVHLANDSSFGLNASVWSSDLRKAERVATRLVTGNVVINDVIITVANHYLPFGGVKQSGIGRYHGEIGLQIFCHQTSVMSDKGKREREVNWFPYEGKLPLFFSLIRSYFGKHRSWGGLLKSYLHLLRK
ncbi:aldehyde dehydrogenase family protein [Microaerobacter geothermalis]|nr:aldehyde dehydrogenase family protein [Microaerobacter geothermalis]MCF6095046.1 aldehyde dehydrogenase family protein [Microaerobacter geothermalis]